MKIIDVNILVFAVDRLSPHHASVSSWWKAALNGDEEIGLPWIAVSGFLRIATNARLFPHPLTVEEAIERIEEWIARPNVRFVQETSNHWTDFRDFVQSSGAGGNRATDAHLAALAVSHGATLVSCDTGFARFRRLRWENPAAV
jgi:toxin-antitoxin system PIN domain toxin